MGTPRQTTDQTIVTATPHHAEKVPIPASKGVSGGGLPDLLTMGAKYRKNTEPAGV